MTIDPETLMAYADGELDMLAARRVERAAAEDPALAEQVRRHRALRAELGRHFDPVLAAPAPALEALVRDSAKVADLAGAQAARRRTPAPAWWRNAGAIAAALVLGLILGQVLQPGGTGEFASRDGRLVARGGMARALETQLASAPDAEVRTPVTFRTSGGDYCRVFETAAQGGIACREGVGEWTVRALRATETAKTEFRQAGSGTAALMAQAQEMMAYEPLDEAAQRAAIAGQWSAR